MAAKPTVLVTGASGFLGSHCVKALLDAGYQVRGTVRSLEDEPKVKAIRDLDRNGRLELFEADLTSAKGWHRAVEGCKYVLQVACCATLYDDEETSVNASIDGTLRVLRAVAASTTVERVVHTSAASAIYDTRLNVGDKVFSEADWTDVTLPNTDAEVRSKVLAERAAWAFVRENTGHHFDLVVVNPALLIGPLLLANDITSAVQTVKSTLESTSWETMDISMVFCDVRDAARAHLNAMTAAEAVDRRHLIVQQPSYNLKEIAKDLAAEFNPQGYTIPTRPIPYWFLFVVGWLVSWFVPGAENLAKLGKELKFDNSRVNPQEQLRYHQSQKVFRELSV